MFREMYVRFFLWLHISPQDTAGQDPPMAGSSYGRESFQGFRIFILVGTVASAFIFTGVHTVNRLFYTKATLKSNSKRLNNAIVLANWMFTCMEVPYFITHTIVSPDDSPTICRNMHLWGLISYMLINFCFYRVLLYKSQAYDVMREYPKIYFYAFWAVHIMCPTLTLGAVTIYALGKYRILTENISGGSRLCILYGYHYLEFLAEGPIAPFMAAFTDLAISLGCLLLLVLPLMKPGFNPTGETGVMRNVIFSSIAIFSTFSILLAMASMELKENWTAGLVMELGALDLMLNIICINLCWPARFYVRVGRRICLSALGLEEGTVNTSEKRKNANSSGIKSKDLYLRPHISTRGESEGKQVKDVEKDALHDSKIIAISPKSHHVSPSKALYTPSGGQLLQNDSKVLINSSVTRSPKAVGSVSRRYSDLKSINHAR
ncbi:hypothetical protein AAMO2058_000420000 [Amorphochlora amoebiformis]